MVVQCPVGVSASGIVIEVRVCSSDSVGIGKAVLWQVQCNMARSMSTGEDIMVVRCPVRRLGIVRRDRSCMLEQWATIHRVGIGISISVFVIFVCCSIGRSEG
jgi:hypothetical protein